MRSLSVFNILAVALLFLAIGLVAVPDARSRQAITNEVAVVRVLQDLALSQARFRHDGQLDSNGDGAPEFGFLGDLRSGGRDGRSYLPASATAEGGAPLDVFRGYRIGVLLPSKSGAPVPDTDRDRVDANLAAHTFLIVAWPARPGREGTRVYAVHHDMIVVEHPNGDLRIGGTGLPSDLPLPRLAQRDEATGRVLKTVRWPRPFRQFLEVHQAVRMRNVFHAEGIPLTPPMVAAPPR